MRSKITDKFQITIPKEIRSRMKLSKNDSIEWKIDENGVAVLPVRKPFLNLRGSIHVGAGDIKTDIEKARKYMAEKNT